MAQIFKAKTLVSSTGIFSHKAIAPNLVYNTGDQNIGGTKTLTGNLILKPNNQEYHTANGLSINTESGIVRINTNLSSSYGAGFQYSLTGPADPGVPLNIEGRGKLIHNLGLDGGSSNFTPTADHFHLIFATGPSNIGSNNGPYGTNYSKYQFSNSTRPAPNDNERDTIHLTTLEAKPAGNLTFPSDSLTALYLSTTGTFVVTPPGTGLVELGYSINGQNKAEYLHSLGELVFLKINPGVAGIVANTYNGKVVSTGTFYDNIYSLDTYKVGIALAGLGVNSNFNSSQKSTSTQSTSWNLSKSTTSNSFTGISYIQRSTQHHTDQFDVFYKTAITAYTGESLVVDVYNIGAGTFITSGINLTQGRYDGYVSKVLSPTGLEVTLAVINYGSLGGFERPNSFTNPSLTSGIGFISSEAPISGMKIYRGSMDSAHRNYWAHNVFSAFRNIDAGTLNVPAGVITRIALGGLNRVEAASTSALGYNNQAYVLNSHAYGAHQKNSVNNSVRIGAENKSYINIVSGKLGVNLDNPSAVIDIASGDFVGGPASLSEVDTLTLSGIEIKMLDSNIDNISVIGSITARTGIFGVSNTRGGTEATIGGGCGNCAFANFSTVGGGDRNTASASASTIGGGFGNIANSNCATVGGGRANYSFGQEAFIGGGNLNIACCLATVGGGFGNCAFQNYSTVAGGRVNKAVGVDSFIGGGNQNIACCSATVGGGFGNCATGQYSFVGGGERNCALATNSYIIGGLCSIIQTSHFGAAILGDGQARAHNSFSPNSLTLDFASGVYFSNKKIFGFVPQMSHVNKNFLISGDFNSSIILANSASIITGTLISGNPTGFSASIIQIGVGQISIVGSGSNVIINSFNNQYKTAGQFATISILHSGDNKYYMYGNTI
jgi:hypothetical protein